VSASLSLFLSLSPFTKGTMMKRGGVGSVAVENGIDQESMDPSTQEAEAGDHKFQASLGYIVKPCLKICYTEQSHNCYVGKHSDGGGEWRQDPSFLPFFPLFFSSLPKT
jgi:hypothetical protein